MGQNRPFEDRIGVANGLEEAGRFDMAELARPVTE
jgi:predicted FMN-binding regulatory protein PaiB